MSELINSIDVKGGRECFEGAEHRNYGVRCCQMHSVFVENLMKGLLFD